VAVPSLLYTHARLVDAERLAAAAPVALTSAALKKMLQVVPLLSGKVKKRWKMSVYHLLFI